MAADARSIPPIRQTTFIRAPVGRVFETLTTGAGWDAFFTDGAEISPAVGGPVVLKWQDFGPDHVNIKDGGVVCAIEPDKQFTFTWHPAKYATTVDIRLSPAGDGTRLELTESGYEIGDLDVLVDCAAGWGEAITLLKFYLEHGVTYGRWPG